MSDKITISAIREAFRIEDGGGSTQTRQILYRVGDDGPFSLEISAADFEAGKARELLEKQAREITALRQSLET